jgi:cell shape-determining protein MreD
MKWFFFIFSSLFFIVLQTVIFPGASWFSNSFDLTIMLIVFLSLNFPRYWMTGVIACIGGIMDSLSGGPFFLYLFSYLWIFLIVQLIKQLVFQTSALFVVAVSLVAVLIQQGVFLFSIFVGQDHATLQNMDITLMVQQAVWGAVMIPPGVWTISFLFGQWQKMGRAVAQTRGKKRNGQYG